MTTVLLRDVGLLISLLFVLGYALPKAVATHLLKQKIKALLTDGHTTASVRRFIRDNERPWYLTYLVWLKRYSSNEYNLSRFLKRFTYRHFGSV